MKVEYDTNLKSYFPTFNSHPHTVQQINPLSRHDIHPNHLPNNGRVKKNILGAGIKLYVFTIVQM